MTCRKERDGSEPRSRAARAAYARRTFPRRRLVSARDTQSSALLVKGLFQVHGMSYGTNKRKGAARDAALRPHAGSEGKPECSCGVAAALVVLYSKLRCTTSTQQLNHKFSLCLSECGGFLAFLSIVAQLSYAKRAQRLFAEECKMKILFLLCLQRGQQYF